MKSENKKSVLIVDDETVLLNTLEIKFKSEGIEVYKAKDGKEGLDLVSKKMPDIVLLDLVMPNMDGVEMLKLLREREEFKELPVIILSNLTQEDKKREVEKYNITDYILKTSTSMSDVVNRVITFLK